MSRKKNNNTFELSYYQIRKVCELMVKKYNHLYIKIDRSPYNPDESFYLRFMLKGYTTSLRISNHHTKLTAAGGGIRNLIVNEFTTVSTVTSKCERAIKDLFYKIEAIKIDSLYKTIENKRRTFE